MKLNKTIVEKFNDKYKNWDLRIDQSVHIKDNIYEVKGKGWNIRFIVEESDSNSNIEVYASHRMTSDTHFRIDSNGEIETLDSCIEFLVYDPKVKGDKEIQDKYRRDYNKKVYKSLVEKGLV